MKPTTTIAFDRARLNSNLIDLGFLLDAVVGLIAAAGELFDGEQYDLPAGGGYLLNVIARDAAAAMTAFTDMRVQITGVDPAKVDADSVVANIVLPA